MAECPSENRKEIMFSEYADDDDDETYRSEQLNGRMRFIQQIYLAYEAKTMLAGERNPQLIIADGDNLKAIQNKLTAMKKSGLIYVYDKTGELELKNERFVEAFFSHKQCTSYQLAMKS